MEPIPTRRIECSWTWEEPKPTSLWRRFWDRLTHVLRTRTWYTLEERLCMEMANQIQAEIDAEIIADLIKLSKEQK